MTTIDFLTQEDQKWLALHRKLATLSNYDIVEYSSLILDNDHIDAASLKEIVYLEVSNDAIYPTCECHDSKYEYLDVDCEYCCLNRQKRKEFLTHCRKATYIDYAVWKKGYKNELPGPKRKFTKYNFYVLESEPEFILPLYGADSISLILPSRFRLMQDNGARVGHNSLFFMHNFEYRGPTINPPLY